MDLNTEHPSAADAICPEMRELGIFDLAPFRPSAGGFGREGGPGKRQGKGWSGSGPKVGRPVELCCAMGGGDLILRAAITTYAHAYMYVFIGALESTCAVLYYTTMNTTLSRPGKAASRYMYNTCNSGDLIIIASGLPATNCVPAVKVRIYSH